VTDPEQEKFESALRTAKPAKLPEHFAARLLAAIPPAEPGAVANSRRGPRVSDFLKLLRWLTPATAALVLAAAVMLWRRDAPTTGQQAGALLDAQYNGAGEIPPALKADDVRIDQELVSSFDAVARLPSGEPVRFRCQTWMDQVALSDNARGVFIENRSPRVQVFPIRFESY
jgi:hypothetical protein